MQSYLSLLYKESFFINIDSLYLIYYFILLFIHLIISLLCMLYSKPFI